MPARLTPSISSRHLGDVPVAFDPEVEYKKGGFPNRPLESYDKSIDARPAKRQRWIARPLCWTFRYRHDETNRKLIRAGLIDAADPYQRGMAIWTGMSVAIVPSVMFGEKLTKLQELLIPWRSHYRREAYVYPLEWRRIDDYSRERIHSYEGDSKSPFWTAMVIRERGVDADAVRSCLKARWSHITAEPTGYRWHVAQQPPWLGLPVPPDAVIEDVVQESR